jgi:predicted Ser/Thr protein kinase
VSGSSDAAGLQDWLRARLAAEEGVVLAEGYQAYVRLYRGPYGPLVVKSPHLRSLQGLVGRATIKHEHAVYARLEGIAGIPRCFGLIDGRHLVLQYIEGRSLRQGRSELRDSSDFYARLLRTLQAMHAAGVAHGDLKRKDNLIIGPGERPYIVDFGIACIRPPSGRGWRALRFDMTRQMDINAWIKLKYGRRRDAISAEDLPLYRPLWIERVARWLRIGWQKASLRRPRQRWRRRRAARAGAKKVSDKS